MLRIACRARIGTHCTRCTGSHRRRRASRWCVACPGFGSRQHRGDQRPLPIGQIAWTPQIIPVMLIASGIVPRHLILHPHGRSGEAQATDIPQILSNRALRDRGRASDRWRPAALTAAHRDPSGSIQDRDGAVLALNRRTWRRFPFVEVVFADQGYQGAKAAKAVAGTGKWRLEIVCDVNRGQRASRCCPNGGSSSARCPGSGATADWPETSNTSPAPRRPWSSSQ